MKMTKERLRGKFNKLIRENNKMMTEKFEKLLKSGAIDFAAWDDDFVLPKLIMTAMGKEMINQWRPFDKRWSKEIENFYIMM